MANSPSRSTLEVGSVIDDTYRLEQLIGRGGMGAVFLASHLRLPGKQVAIKVLHPDVADEEVLARFHHEAIIASQLNHPNIVGVHDFDQTPDGTPYLVLDYLVGETLAQRLHAGPIPLEHALSIMREVGSALAAAHRNGVIHRDLKPQNIFLVKTEVDGRTIEVAKVLDFGISKMRSSQTVKTQDNSLLGTPQYMSPEQATGQHARVDERTDVFALGSILYEMLAGHPAFSGASIPEVVFKVVYEQPPPISDEAPTLPHNVTSAIEQAMAKTANDRFATVGGFVEALTGEPLALPHTTGQQPLVDTAAPPSGSRKVASGTGKPLSVDEQMGETAAGVAPLPPVVPRVAASAAARDAAIGNERTLAGVGAPPVAANSATVSSIDSHEPRPHPVAVPAAPPPVAPAAAAAPQLAAAPRSWLPIAVGLGGAVVAAIAVYLVMRSPGAGAPPPPPRPRIAAASPPADAASPLAASPPADAASPLAASPLAASPPADAAPAAAHHDATTTTTTTTTTAAHGEPLAAAAPTNADLDRAQAAYAAHDYAGAIRAAQHAILDAAASDAVKARAHGIAGDARCQLQKDVDARTDLNALSQLGAAGGATAAARTRIKTSCAAVDMPIE